MKTIHAVYENGIFRPTEPVELPDRCRVVFEPRLIDPTVREMIDALRQTDPELASVYEILARRHNGGQRDVAERHNEHQP